MRGTVEQFGADGWGLLRSDDGLEYRFHSTAIADGSRAIATDTPVTFSVVPGRQGLWEATAVAPATEAASTVSDAERR